MPRWTADEWRAYKERTARYLAICRQLDAMRLNRKADVLVTEIEQIWLESESAAEDRVLRMVGQDLVQAGHAELFRSIYELVVQGTPRAAA